jgi:hypothetical protein
VAGLSRGDGLLVIATEKVVPLFREELVALGIDPDALVHDGRLTILDSRKTLDQILLGGRPDWKRFVRTVTPMVRKVRDQSPSGQVCAYGDMVGLLWRAGYFGAAICLEECWNQLLASDPFPLFCAYPIDVLDAEFHPKSVYALLCDHSRLVPSHEPALDPFLDLAAQDVLGTTLDVSSWRSSKEWAALPNAETRILAIRDLLPQHADEILARTREYYASRC